MPLQIARGAIAYAYNLSFGRTSVNGSESSTSQSSNTLAENNTEFCLVGDLSCNVTFPNTTGSPADPPPARKGSLEAYASISQLDWQRHMQHYVDPNHVSLRTSQLMSVDIPIDHNAILWCKEFVSVVVHGIEALVQLPVASNTPSARIDWSRIFPMNRLEGNVTRMKELYDNIEQMGFIPPVREYLRRNLSSGEWIGFESLERAAVIQAGRGTFGYLLSFLGTIAYEIVTFHHWKIFSCYVIIACLVSIYPLTRQLSGYIMAATLPATSLLMPYHHLHLDIFTAASNYWLGSYIKVIPHVEKVSLPAVAVSIIIGKVLIDWIRFSSDVFIVSYGSILSWIIAYPLAMCVWGISYTVLHVFAVSLSSAYTILGTPFYYTLWKPMYMRNICERVCRPFRFLDVIDKPDLLSFSCQTSLLGVLLWLASSKSSDRVSTVSFISNLMIVTLSVSLILWPSVSLVRSRSISPSPRASLIHLMLLYVPVILLVAPSFSFAVQLIGLEQNLPKSIGMVLSYLAVYSEEVVHLYSAFTPEIFNYIVILVVVNYHVFCSSKLGYVQHI